MYSNPTKKLPCIDDNGFIIFESHTILRYLSEKYCTSKWYPTDFKLRAKVDMYLDWHHTNTRAGAAPTVFNTVFGPSIPGYKVAGPDRMKSYANLLAKTLKFIDQVYLKDKKYIHGLDEPTIADLSCFSELASLFMMNYDFTPYVNIVEWMSKMKKIAFYDKVHAGMNKFIKSKL
jgi:glutathione S-transferase